MTAEQEALLRSLAAAVESLLIGQKTTGRSGSGQRGGTLIWGRAAQAFCCRLFLILGNHTYMRSAPTNILSGVYSGLSRVLELIERIMRDGSLFQAGGFTGHGIAPFKETVQSDF